jgi:hypothetical protein
MLTDAQKQLQGANKNIAIIVFLTLTIILYFYFKQRFGDWILSPSSGEDLLSWAQSVELVPIYGHQLVFVPEDGNRI